MPISITTSARPHPVTRLSNLFNKLTISPTPQLQFQTLASTALNSNSYNEIDTNAIWSPDPSLQFTIGDSYINHSTIFGDSNQATLDLFYRMNEHWQLEAQEQFEATTGHLPTAAILHLPRSRCLAIGHDLFRQRIEQPEQPHGLFFPNAKGVSEVPAPFAASLITRCEKGSRRRPCARYLLFCASLARTLIRCYRYN